MIGGKLLSFSASVTRLFCVKSADRCCHRRIALLDLVEVFEEIIHPYGVLLGFLFADLTFDDSVLEHPSRLAFADAENAPYVFEGERFGIVASYFFSDGNHLSPSFIEKYRRFPSSQWSARYSTRSIFAIM